MYLRHWKLAQRPFDERVDPRWFFSSTVHQEVLLKLQHAVEQRAGIAILAGGLGCGKSMVATLLAEGLSRETHPVFRFALTPATAIDGLEGIVEQLRHSTPSASASTEGTSEQRAEAAVEELERLLAERAEAGQHPVVILDAADWLKDAELHGLVRLLRSLNVQRQPALTTVLIGSVELLVRARRVAETDDQLFPQCLLGAMPAADTAGYITHRIRMAGGEPSLFSEPAHSLIHDLSGGIPRRINRLCDLSLLVGFAEEADQIDPKHVWTAQSEIRVLAPTRTATAPAPHHWRPLSRRQLQHR